jgi:hypothetical protein
MKHIEFLKKCQNHWTLLNIYDGWGMDDDRTAIALPPFLSGNNRSQVRYVSGELALKVVGNEKGGGSGGWLLFEDAFGPRRSMSVYLLMLPSSFPQHISVSCL